MKIKITKQEKENIKRICIKIVLAFLLLILVVGSYNIGRMRGTIDGLNIGLKSDKEDICSFFELERDTDGFCILSEDGEYNEYEDCGWEKFKIKGREPLTGLRQFVSSIINLIYYPFTGC